MKRSTAFILIAMLLGISILLALGTWQVKRLFWKEKLIATVKTRIDSVPTPLADVITLWTTDRDVGYYPVSITGEFDDENQAFFYTTYKGAVGWEILSPFKLEDGRTLIVNRGFVPDQLREEISLSANGPPKKMTIKGLARNPLYEKPNRFMPENDLQAREFFWKDFNALARLLVPGPQKDLIPFIIDQSAPQNESGLPKVGTTRISFPNNHLQYAITWYGLALALLGVGTYFLYARRINTANNEI